MLLLPDIEKHILGINNRDLQTFKVDLANTKDIMESAAGKQVKGSRKRRVLLSGWEGDLKEQDAIKKGLQYDFFL